MECEADHAPALAEFWMLLAFYVKSLSSQPQATQALEDRVLPLLDRFEFLEKCQDVRALRSIIDDLHLAGLGIPFASRRALACKLLRRALESGSRDCASEYIVFAMRLVDRNFHAITSAIAEAKASLLGADDRLEFMHCVVEEELCQNIVGEQQLLQYANQYANQKNRGLEASLRKGLNAEMEDVRVQTLRLGFAYAFHSRAIFSTLQPVFEAALYLENFEVRELVLAGLMDLIYMHHQDLEFHEVRHLLLPFLYVPNAKMQYSAVVGCGRILLENCFPDDVEQLLSAMLERQVYSIPRTSSMQESLQPVAHALHVFFESYAPGHPDEMANALVYLCLEKIEAGVIVVSATSVQYSSSKRQEGRDLQLALRFGLDIAGGGIQNSVMEGLAANLDNVTMESCLGLLNNVLVR